MQAVITDIRSTKASSLLSVCTEHAVILTYTPAEDIKQEIKMMHLRNARTDMKCWVVDRLIRRFRYCCKNEIFWRSRTQWYEGASPNIFSCLLRDWPISSVCIVSDLQSKVSGLIPCAKTCLAKCKKNKQNSWSKHSVSVQREKKVVPEYLIVIVSYRHLNVVVFLFFSVLDKKYRESVLSTICPIYYVTAMQTVCEELSLKLG